MAGNNQGVVPAPTTSSGTTAPPVARPDGFQDRSKMVDRIQTKLDTKLLIYVTGDRPGMETQISREVPDLFVDHLDALWPAKKITLFLYTTGGDTSAAWSLVNLLRTFCDELEVIVFSKAFSAGTLMCLGANKTIMTKQARLGPIDPSLNGPMNPTIPHRPGLTASVSVEAVQGYLDVVQQQLKIGDQAALASMWNSLSEKIHPLVLGQIFRTRTQIRSLAMELLDNQKLDDDTKNKIISFLCSDSGSHDHAINRREAKKLGLLIEKPSEDVYEMLKELHLSIVGTLNLLEPWRAEQVLGTNNSVKYTERRGLIESTAGGSHQFVAEGILTSHAINGQQQIIDRRLFEGWRKEA
jgi:hypothetical protein